MGRQKSLNLNLKGGKLIKLGNQGVGRQKSSNLNGREIEPFDILVFNSTTYGSLPLSFGTGERAGAKQRVLLSSCPYSPKL